MTRRRFSRLPLPRHPESYRDLLDVDEQQIRNLTRAHEGVLRNPLAIEAVAQKSLSVLRKIQTSKSVLAQRRLSAALGAHSEGAR